MKPYPVAKLAVAIALAGACAANVSAAPMKLDQLYFSQSAGWLNPGQFTGPGAPGPTDLGFFGEAQSPDPNYEMIPFSGGATGPSGTEQGIRWFDADVTTDPEFSQIEISSFDTTTSNDDFGTTSAMINDDDGNGEWNEGEFWVIDELVQLNNVLTSSSDAFPNPLWRADTLADFKVFSDVVGGNEIIDDSGSTTRIEFWESINTGSSGSCAPADPYAGTAPPCADRYRIAAEELDPVSSDPFMGYVYTINFTLFPGPVTGGGAPTGNDALVTEVQFRDSNGDLVDPLTNPDDAVTVDGFTPEFGGSTSRLYVAASWTATAVPEPSVFAMLGAGLLAAGIAGRGRRRK